MLFMYFDGCKTTEELAVRRNNLLAEINKEYQDMRQIIVSAPQPFKKVPIIEVPVPKQEIVTYMGVPHVKGKVAANEVIVSKDSTLVI